MCWGRTLRAGFPGIQKTPVTFAGDAAGSEKFFKLEQWKISDGTDVREQIIWRRGDFVLVVATTQAGNVVVIKERKQAVEQDLYCLPAGTVKKGEIPLDAALRELKDESGYVGNGHTAVTFGPYYNSPDKSTERHWIVVLQNVVKGDGPNPEPGEAILSAHELSPAQAIATIRIGMHRLALYEASLDTPSID